MNKKNRLFNDMNKSIMKLQENKAESFQLFFTITKILMEKFPTFFWFKMSIYTKLHKCTIIYIIISFDLPCY